MCLIECLLNILDQVDSITKPDSGLLLNHPFTYWARRIAGRPAAAYDQMALLMTG